MGCGVWERARKGRVKGDFCVLAWGTGRVALSVTEMRILLLLRNHKTLETITPSWWGDSEEWYSTWHIAVTCAFLFFSREIVSGFSQIFKGWRALISWHSKRPWTIALQEYLPFVLADPKYWWFACVFSWQVQWQMISFVSSWASQGKHLGAMPQYCVKIVFPMSSQMFISLSEYFLLCSKRAKHQGNCLLIKTVNETSLK